MAGCSNLRVGIRTSNSRLSSRKFYKHYMVDALVGDEQCISSFFNDIVILGVHSYPSECACTDFEGTHYHCLGQAKFTNRLLRDMSITRLEAAGIQNVGASSKDIFLSSRQRHIIDNKHFENTINYIRRQCIGNIIKEEKEAKFEGKFDIFAMIDDIKEPVKFSEDEMFQFRSRYPNVNQWRAEAIQKKFPKHITDNLVLMEDQRIAEDYGKPLSIQEHEMLMWNWPFLKICKKLNHLIEAMPKNTGCCLILCGKSNTLKSTICRVLAQSYGNYAIWPGSQWIQKDILKFDTAARKGVTTIVCEEMVWYDTPRKITLESTINSIKEQLTGSGIDIRLSKSNNKESDMKFKMERLFISMNPSDLVSYRILKEKLASKAEYVKRFIVYNMDQHEKEITEMREDERLLNQWELGCSDKMERLCAKAMAKPKILEKIEWDYDENSVEHEQWEMHIERKRLRQLEEDLPDELNEIELE